MAEANCSGPLFGNQYLFWSQTCVKLFSWKVRDYPGHWRMFTNSIHGANYKAGLGRRGENEPGSTVSIRVGRNSGKCDSG
jgi:hypothetical protein